MEDKFSKYYYQVDVFDITKRNNISFDEDSDSEEESFFKLFFPFNMAVLMNHLESIIYKMCDNFSEKEKVEEQIKVLYNEINCSKDFTWKDLSLKELIKGNYTYLKEKFILKHIEVPDNSHFVNNYTFPEDEFIYPFSLKELYAKLLERGINVTINNYYLEKNNKTSLDFLIKK